MNKQTFSREAERKNFSSFLHLKRHCAPQWLHGVEVGMAGKT